MATTVKYKSFFQNGLLIQAIKMKEQHSKKHMFIFEIYIGGVFAGSTEFHASSLQSAKKKLDIWLSYNFPEDSNSNLGTNEVYTEEKKVAKNFICRIIDERHKICPECGKRNLRSERFCAYCFYEFFRGY